jgi:aconitate hydratase
VRTLIENGSSEIPLLVNGREIITRLDVSERQRKELLAGGTLNFVRNKI